MLRSLRYVGVRVSFRGDGSNPANRVNAAGAAFWLLVGLRCPLVSASGVSSGFPLVIEANGNGRVGGISKRFGNRSQGNHGAVATYEGRGLDSLINSVWASIKIEQGKRHFGGLKLLDHLGIIAPSLAYNPLHAAVSVGTSLQGCKSLRFANERASGSAPSVTACNDNSVLPGGGAPFDRSKDHGVTEGSGNVGVEAAKCCPRRDTFRNSGQRRVSAVEQGNALERVA